MGITTSLTMSSPVAVRPRGRTSFDEAVLERVATDRSGHVTAQALWEAQVAGDRVAIRSIASAFLASTSNAPTGTGRERLLLVGAAAHADHVDVRSVGDLILFLDAMVDGLALMQVAAMDFGHRRPGVLESPASGARHRIEETRRAVERLVVPGQATPWAVVRNLSFFGDFFLSAALSRTLHLNGDGGNAEVVRAAHLRRLHQHPEMAVEIIDELLTTTLHPWGLNCKAASLGDLCEFDAAAEVALLSIAVRPNEYSGNVGRRAFRNIGRRDLSEAADRLAMWSVRGSVPQGFTGSHRQMISVLAVDLLHAAGRGDLAELQLQTHRSSEPWARAAREAIDTGRSPRAAVREVLA